MERTGILFARFIWCFVIKSPSQPVPKTQDFEINSLANLVSTVSTFLIVWHADKPTITKAIIKNLKFLKAINLYIFIVSSPLTINAAVPHTGPNKLFSPD